MCDIDRIKSKVNTDNDNKREAAPEQENLSPLKCPTHRWRGRKNTMDNRKIQDKN